MPANRDTHFQGREVVTLHDQYGTRCLVVPSREPRRTPGFWPRPELERLQSQAHIVTPQDRIALLEEAQQRRTQQIEDSEMRKAQLRQNQKGAKAPGGSRLRAVESEAKRQNLYILQRSYEMLQEQDERVRAGNRIILAAKCQAVRNAQIAEKRTMERKLREDERRLDAIMEEKRLEAVAREEQKKADQLAKKQDYIKELSEQIQCNEFTKVLEGEKTKEESRIINKVLIAIQKDEAAKHEEKRRRQVEEWATLKQANEDLERHRAQMQEEEHILELRMAKFMADKRAQEEQRERELAAVRRAKERETARIAAQQMAEKNQKNELDELNALRDQEEVEQRWRDKELAEAKKRHDQHEQMTREREIQIDELRRVRAVRLAMDERDFHKVAAIQKRQYEKEAEKREAKKEAALRHCRDILDQIEVKEQKRLDEMKSKFEEGQCLRMEKEMKDRHVKEYMQKKVDKLKANKLLAPFIGDTVVAQLKLS